METSTKYVLVNLDGECMPKMVYAKQGDAGTRVLNFAFVQNQTSTERIVLEENTQAKARFKLPDKTAHEVECEIGTNRDSASVVIPQEALTSPGVLLVDICLYQGEFILSTSTFEIRVLESSLGESSGSVVVGGKFYNVKSLTREQFEALTPADDTIYLVDESNENETIITIYIGSAKIASGGSTSQGASSLYLVRDVEQYSAQYARLTSDENFGLMLAREVFRRYETSRTDYLYFYDEEDEETEDIKRVAKLHAMHKIILEAGDSVLQMSDDGLYFNGKKLGSGGANVGQTVGILSGVTDSVIGTLEEVTE